MAKYKVIIPQPSAKRLAANGRIIITYHDGFEYDLLKQTVPSYSINAIEPNSTEFEFETPDKYAWINSNEVVDGWYFVVEAEYANSIGNRKETYALVPEKITSS